MIPSNRGGVAGFRVSLLFERHERVTSLTGDGGVCVFKVTVFCGFTDSDAAGHGVVYPLSGVYEHTMCSFQAPQDVPRASPERGYTASWPVIRAWEELAQAECGVKMG